MTFGKAFRTWPWNNKRVLGRGKWASVERGGKEQRQSQKTWHNWLYTLLLRWETGNVHLSVLLSPPALISNLISPKSPWKDP